MRRVDFSPESVVYHMLTLLVFLTSLSTFARAERLPLKSFTTADGLAGNSINRIVRDSRGLLWFCTEEGLSRFDGYNFINYGTEQGLPQAGVNDFLETRGGEYWVATNGGLVHFNPKGAPLNRVVYSNEAPATVTPMFTVVVPDDTDRHARYISALLEGRDGTLWCGTYKGLYRMEASGGQFSLRLVDTAMPGDYPEQRYVDDLVEDKGGSIWLATPSGLYRRWPDGSAARYTKRDGLPDDFLHDLMLDHQGLLWVGTRYAGFFRLSFDESHAKPSVPFSLKPHDLVQNEWINQLFETSEHKLWAATAGGLLEFTPGAETDGRPYRFYTSKNGLSGHNVTALNEDTGGNLWLGSGSGAGVMKLARSGFVTYDEQDGVNSVFSVFAERTGGVCFRGYVLGDKNASIFEGGKVELINQNQVIYWPRFARFDGHHLTWFAPHRINNKGFGWVDEGVTLQARVSGEWWVVMGTELYRFPPSDKFTAVADARPLSVFGKESVLGGRQIFRIFEDSQQRVWVSTIAPQGNGIAFWDPNSQSLHDVTSAANLPSPNDDLARAFREDRAGNVWIGFNTGVARFRDGSFTFFTTRDGLPAGAIVDIYNDHDGRLWLASARSGLVRVDDPVAGTPVFKSYTTADGLSGNFVTAITEDSNGRIYAGTGRGLDQFDLATNRIKHYTTADGLAGGKIAAAFRASDGSLWIGTSGGLSHFMPEPERESASPSVLLTGLQLSGSRQNISAVGESDLSLPDLSASASQLEIDFVGLGFAPGESLRYQYKLEGADQDWSKPALQRTVTYARLASGHYRFLVRAVNADGQVSGPASVTFRVLPPLWLRWWFIVLVVLAAGGAAYVFYRYRIGRLLEVANMRTRIATDLHDDIGSNLTKIAILSEVAKQQSADKELGQVNSLTSIAQISRESVAAMSDIVWAINPQRDHLIDVVRRMRRHAEEMFSARNIRLTFSAPGEEQNLRLGVDMRRDLFLIFKEAINNSARHAQCSEVNIELNVSSASLSLEIRDNGLGFDVTRDSDGQGVASMHRRAKDLGGVLDIESRAGEGTVVRLKVPLAHARTFARR